MPRQCWPRCDDVSRSNQNDLMVKHKLARANSLGGGATHRIAECVLKRAARIIALNPYLGPSEKAKPIAPQLVSR